jgi:hypothetical protein
MGLLAYIPKLKSGNSFSMYAKNLDSALQFNAVGIFRTVHYAK